MANKVSKESDSMQPFLIPPEKSTIQTVEKKSKPTQSLPQSQGETPDIRQSLEDNRVLFPDDAVDPIIGGIHLNNGKPTRANREQTEKRR